MPEAMQYTTTIDSDLWKANETAYTSEAKNRLMMIDRHWKYYDGDHDKQLKAQKDGYDDNVIINDVEILAEKSAALLVGDGVTFDTGGDAESDDTDLAIQMLWEDSQGDTLQGNIALSGSVEGHCVVRLLPQTDISGAVIEGSLPRLVRISQKHFSAFWDAFDKQRVLWYRLQTVTATTGRRIDYVKGAVMEDGSTDETAPVWSEVVYEAKNVNKYSGIHQWILQSVTPWPHEWAPLVDWQNFPNPSGYYGKDDVKSAVKLNDNLNFILSNLMRIVKHYAHPKTVGTGFNADEVIPTAVGGLWTIDKADAKVFNLEMQADGNLSRWLAGVVSENLWHSGGMVDPQSIKDKVGQLTNFGLRVLFSDAINRTEKKRALYEEGFQRLNKYALELAGLAVPDTITVVWPDVLPEDAQAEMETLTAEFDRKLISAETYRDRRDYNNEQETDRIAEESINSVNPLAGLLQGTGFDNNGFNRG